MYQPSYKECVENLLTRPAYINSVCTRVWDIPASDQLWCSGSGTEGFVGGLI